MADNGAVEAPLSSRPRTPRWLKVVMVVSLGLNFLVLGAVAGLVAMRLMTGFSLPERIALTQANVAPPFIAAFQPRDQRALSRYLTLNYPDQARRGQRDMRQALIELNQTLRAEEFDRERMSRVIGSQRDAAVRASRVGELALLDIFESMTLEERRAYAERLTEIFRTTSRAIRDN